MRIDLGMAGTACALAACSVVRVPVPVMKPAEINMSAYKQIAVEGVRSNRSWSDQGAQEITMLLQQGLMDSGRFQVLDRQHLSGIMQELKLSASDLADPSNAARLGKQLTAAALIYGTVDENSFQQGMSGPEDCFTDQQTNVRHCFYTRSGRAVVRLSFSVVDVTTGQLLKVKTVECARTPYQRLEDRRPAPFDPGPLIEQCRQQDVHAFIDSITPHQVVVRVPFRKDGDIPQLEQAIAYARSGDWKQARSTVQAGLDSAGKNPAVKPDALAKAWFDLALCDEYTGRFDDAENEVNHAFQLSSDADYLQELPNIRQMRADAQRLQEQGAGPVTHTM